jgi:dimethylamine monooxygenase subunit C
MLVTGIKSKPVYTPLAPDLSGRYHLMVGHGVGSEPLLRILRDLHAAAPDSGARTRVLFVTNVDEHRAVQERFLSAGAAEVRWFSRDSELLTDLNDVLTRSVMGTRLYVAGPESFMGLVMRIARQFNLNKDEVRAEECGSSARRVYCIHCQTATENVTTNIVQCKDCNRWLLVRDHYSSRLAAYMGVMVDAEAPGERPDVKVAFP